MKCDCEEEKKCSIDDDDVMQGSSRSEEKTKKIFLNVCHEV